MRARGRSTRFVSLVLGLAFAVGVRAESADYRANYERGIRAIDQSDWGRAIEALRSAVAENPVEGDRVLIYGMRFKPYLPHYYLGVAYFSTGRCGAANGAWAESERQGAVRQSAEYTALGKLREQCRQEEVADSRSPTVQTGLLVVDALPWGRVERIDDAFGKNWIKDAEYTPVPVSLPPGKYSVTVTTADREGTALVLSAEVRAGKTTYSVAHFQAVDPESYFQSHGWRR